MICGTCGRKKRHDKYKTCEVCRARGLQFYKDNRERMLQLAKTRYYGLDENEKMIKKEYAMKWRTEHPEEYKKRQKGYYRKNYGKNGPKHRERNKEYRLKLKEMAYELLGGYKCSRCGFDDKRALQIDHIIACKQRNRKFVYAEVVKNKENFQVLCANCNWIKRYENNEVAHSIVCNE